MHCFINPCLLFAPPISRIGNSAAQSEAWTRFPPFSRGMGLNGKILAALLQKYGNLYAMSGTIWQRETSMSSLLIQRTEFGPLVSHASLVILWLKTRRISKKYCTCISGAQKALATQEKTPLFSKFEPVIRKVAHLYTSHVLLEDKEGKCSSCMIFISLLRSLKNLRPLAS